MTSTLKQVKTTENRFWKKNIDLFLSRFLELSKTLGLSAESFFLSDGSANPEILALGEGEGKIEPLESKKSGVWSAKSCGKLLHSLYDPEREAISSVKSIHSQKTKACVFEGFALGYAPNAYARLFPDDFLILVEPEPARFFSALLFLDWSPVFLAKNVFLVLGTGVDVVFALIERAGGAESCAFLKNPSHRAHALSYFSALDSKIERNLKKDAINRATFSRFEKVWKRNIEKNSLFLKKSKKICTASSFFGTFSQKPFLILAAGPTLDEFLPFLPSVKESVVTVCVDTALRACLFTGVQPDFVVLTDPQYAAFRHVSGLKSPKSVLVTELGAYPSVLNMKCKKIALASSSCPLELLGFSKQFIEEDKKRGILGSGGSVSTAAWDFSRRCGAKEIFFAGLDLGFPSNRTHSRSSTFEEESHLASNRFFPSETRQVGSLFGANMIWSDDYSGEKILTDDRMRLFSWWFEGKALEFLDVKSYSLSEKSLKIAGFTPISVQDFLFRLGVKS